MDNAHQPASMDNGLTLTQVAQRTGIAKRVLYRSLPVSPIPRTKPRRWSVEAVDAWMRGEV